MSEAGAPSAGASEAAASTDATLSDLVPSVGALVPVFAPTTMTYTWRVPNGTSSVAVTPTSAFAGATIQVNGVAVSSGQASAALPLPSDGSSLKVVVGVTAEDPSVSATYTLSVSVQPLATSLGIYSVGDSTMANYDATVSPNQRGWMQMFPEFITGDVSITNDGVNGTSSKSFYRTPLWNSVKLQLKAGDYVFIQFGHNDEKDAGLEGPGGIGTEAWGAYHDYLSKYVTEARALGAIPILFTPIVRLDWNGTKLDPVALHDLTGNGTAVGDANYPAAMRDVAATLNCPLVDMTLSTQELVERYGPAQAKSILYVSVDNTHLQVMGATSDAQLAAQGLISLGILSDHLSPELGIQENPSALDFGTRYLGSSVDRAFSVLGLSLVPAAGSVTIAAPAGFLVGTSPGDLSATLELPYTQGALPPSTVYVRFQPSLAQAYSEPLTVTPGSGSAQSFELDAAALEMPTGGTEVEARYALDSATAGPSCTATGSITCEDQALSGLYLKDYQPLTLLIPSPTLLGTERLSILSAPAADSWPVESDVNPARYVAYAVTAAAGQTLGIDTVSLYAGGAGGPSLGFRVQYSTQADFGAPSELFAAPDNASNVLTFFSRSPLITVAAGDTFQLRIYPYSKAVAINKFLSLQSVTVHGVAY
jgi:hypothetical protein